MRSGGPVVERIADAVPRLGTLRRPESARAERRRRERDPLERDDAVLVFAAHLAICRLHHRLHGTHAALEGARIGPVGCRPPASASGRRPLCFPLLAASRPGPLEPRLRLSAQPLTPAPTRSAC